MFAIADQTAVPNFLDFFILGRVTLREKYLNYFSVKFENILQIIISMIFYIFLFF